MSSDKISLQERIKTLPPQPLLAAVVLLFLAVIALAILLGLQFSKADRTGLASGETGETGGTDVAAVVNGENIYKDELFEIMYAQGGAESLEQLIARKLIAQEAVRAGIEVSAAEIDEEIEAIVSENFGGSHEEYLGVLEYYGLSEDSFREDARLNLLVRKLALTRLEPSEEEVNEYFEANYETYAQPEQVEARHILVETEEEAMDIISRLEAGEEFAALAAENSLDQSTKDNEGNLGFFNRGEMVPEFEEAVFNMSVGEISGPVATNFGFHVVELLNRNDAEEVEFSDVAETVEEDYIDSRIPTVINEIVQELYSSAEIEYLL